MTLICHKMTVASVKVPRAAGDSNLGQKALRRIGKQMMIGPKKSRNMREFPASRSFRCMEGIESFSDFFVVDPPRGRPVGAAGFIVNT